MSIYLPAAVRRQLEEADDHRCAYCQTSQANSGQRMVPDHIVPESQGGAKVFAQSSLPIFVLPAACAMSTKARALQV